MTRLLVFGDLHLGAGSALGRQPGDRLADQAAVLDEIVELAIACSVEGIVNCGDTFEGPLVTPEQLDVFAGFVSHCRHVGIPMLAITGNGKHDAAMRTAHGMKIFDHIAGITVSSRPAVHMLGPVAVATLPWVSPARLIAEHGAGVERDRINEHCAGLLVQVARGLREDRSGPMVLALHGSVEGASLPTGLTIDMPGIPVMAVDALADLGYDAIVCSHIHVPQAWHPAFGWGDSAAGDVPPFFYTGSPLALNFGETDVPHGVWILDIEPAAARAEFVTLNGRPLRRSTLDLAALATETVDPIAEFGGFLTPAAWPDVDGAIVKVTVRATRAQQRRLDIAQLRDAVIDAGAHTVKIEIDAVREQRSRVDTVDDELDPLDAFDAWTAANEIDQRAAAAARDQLTEDLAVIA